MTMVTIRGAGHLVPLNKPEEGLVLIDTFLLGKQLPTHRWQECLGLCDEFFFSKSNCQGLDNISAEVENNETASHTDDKNSGD